MSRTLTEKKQKTCKNRWECKEKDRESKNVSKRNLRNKNSTEMKKKSLIILSVHLTTMSEQSVNLKICQ